MKLKKKVKRLIFILILIIILIVGVIFVPKLFKKDTSNNGPKVINKIDSYGYELKDNKSKEYQVLFKDLEKILNEKEVDEKAYVDKLAEMFIVDFYSLSDKTSKTDVGGVDIVHPDALSNFLKNAENTFYKYVESNIYNNRSQNLPKVSTVTINSTDNTTYTYNDTTDDKAYTVNVSWTYTDTAFSDYQSSAILTIIHKDNKLYLVELK